MKYWIKLDRLAAWLLLLSMTLYFVSGFGMTKGLISYSAASYLHLDLLTLVVILAFTMHGAFATRLALIRWRLWAGPLKIVWVLFFVLFLGFFVYVDRFYKLPVVQNNVTTSQSSEATSLSSSSVDSEYGTAESANSASSANSNASTSGSTSSKPVYNASSLAKYNGLNGNPAYVAVDGLVYDFSSVFRNGSHAGYSAGMDQSAAFHTHHSTSILSGYTVVGTYTP